MLNACMQYVHVMRACLCACTARLCVCCSQTETLCERECVGVNEHVRVHTHKESDREKGTS